MIEKFHITKEERGISLLQVLRKRFSLSNKVVKQALLGSACFVNEKRETFGSYKVQSGDRVRFHLDSFKIEKPKLEEILYEDRELIAYNKPPFFVSDTTCNVHRLDKETSGVILQAKAHKKAFWELFRKREIQKVYYAIVQGEVQKKGGEIVSNLGVKEQLHGQKMMGNMRGGSPSITKWTNKGSLGGYTLLKCEPKTGRTHQIRVHLASMGYPVLGDYQYGGAFKKKVPRMLLHAHTLSFIHPITQIEITITAPIPTEFLEFFHEDMYC